MLIVSHNDYVVSKYRLLLPVVKHVEIPWRVIVYRYGDSVIMAFNGHLSYKLYKSVCAGFFNKLQVDVDAVNVILDSFGNNLVNQLLPSGSVF